MSEAQFRRDNHYVPCVYLRHFSTPAERVSVYRTLVPHDHCPLWREKSIKSVGYRAHLYTRIAAGRETDEIETWLDSEFEAPAAAALQKVTSDERLKPEDWASLVRFVAAQDVRTPARLGEFLTRCHADMPHLLNSILRDSLEELKAAKQSGASIAPLGSDDRNYLPVRAVAEVVPRGDTAKLGLRAVVGRGLWLFAIRHWLTVTLEVLHQHRWSILIPPHDISWFTSDNPASVNEFGTLPS